MGIGEWIGFIGVRRVVIGVHGTDIDARLTLIGVQHTLIGESLL